MKISKDGFKVKENISIGDYLVMVEEIVDFSFNRDKETGRIIEYTPHYVTAGLPALIVNYCIDGVEIEPNEAGAFNAELVNAVRENEELNEVVNSIIDGSCCLGYFNECSDVPHYFYTALEDAKKIIKLELDKLSPANMMLLEMTSFLANVNDSFKDIDIKKFADNLDAIFANNDVSNVEDAEVVKEEIVGTGETEG